MCFLLRRPEGTAFLKFKKADASVAAISAANTASGVGVLLKGRQLNVMRAVGKKAAHDIELKKTEEKNVDHRNLYLAKVHISPSPHKSLEILLSACFSNTLIYHPVLTFHRKVRSLMIHLLLRVCLRKIWTGDEGKTFLTFPYMHVTV